MSICWLDFETKPMVCGMAFQQNTRNEVRYINGDGQIAGALSAEAGMKQQNYIHSVMQPPAHAEVEPAYGVNAIALAENAISGKPMNGGNGTGFTEGGPMHTLNATGVHGVAQPIGLDEEQNAMVNAFGTLKARTEGGGFEGTVMQTDMAVRRLTPTECERLQGFPDGYTNIKDKCPDGPRYKALGNSFAVPVVRWLGERINEVAFQTNGSQLNCD